jgi:predicted dinucleotide-binding enzyme
MTRPRRHGSPHELGESATALPLEAPFGGEVVILAVDYPGIKEAASEYADGLAGKVVVDITTPVDTQTWDRLATPPGTSSAEEVQALLPDDTPVVKASRSPASNSTCALPGTTTPLQQRD